MKHSNWLIENSLKVPILQSSSFIQQVTKGESRIKENNRYLAKPIQDKIIYLSMLDAAHVLSISLGKIVRIWQCSEWKEVVGYEKRGGGNCQDFIGVCGSNFVCSGGEFGGLLQLINWKEMRVVDQIAFNNSIQKIRRVQQEEMKESHLEEEATISCFEGDNIQLLNISKKHGDAKHKIIKVLRIDLTKIYSINTREQFGNMREVSAMVSRQFDKEKKNIIILLAGLKGDLIKAECLIGEIPNSTQKVQFAASATLQQQQWKGCLIHQLTNNVFVKWIAILKDAFVTGQSNNVITQYDLKSSLQIRQVQLQFNYSLHVQINWRFSAISNNFSIILFDLQELEEKQLLFHDQEQTDISAITIHSLSSTLAIASNNLNKPISLLPISQDLVGSQRMANKLNKDTKQYLIVNNNNNTNNNNHNNNNSHNNNNRVQNFNQILFQNSSPIKTDLTEYLDSNNKDNYFDPSIGTLPHQANIEAFGTHNDHNNLFTQQICQQILNLNAESVKSQYGQIVSNDRNDLFSHPFQNGVIFHEGKYYYQDIPLHTQVIGNNTIPNNYNRGGFEKINNHINSYEQSQNSQSIDHLPNHLKYEQYSGSSSSDKSRIIRKADPIRKQLFAEYDSANSLFEASDGRLHKTNNGFPFLWPSQSGNLEANNSNSIVKHSQQTASGGSSIQTQQNSSKIAQVKQNSFNKNHNNNAIEQDTKQISHFQLHEEDNQIDNKYAQQNDESAQNNGNPLSLKQLHSPNQFDVVRLLNAKRQIPQPPQNNFQNSYEELKEQDESEYSSKIQPRSNRINAYQYRQDNLPPQMQPVCERQYSEGNSDLTGQKSHMSEASFETPLSDSNIIVTSKVNLNNQKVNEERGRAITFANPNRQSAQEESEFDNFNLTSEQKSSHKQNNFETLLGRVKIGTDEKQLLNSQLSQQEHHNQNEREEDDNDDEDPLKRRVKKLEDETSLIKEEIVKVKKQNASFKAELVRLSHSEMKKIPSQEMKSPFPYCNYSVSTNNSLLFNQGSHAKKYLEERSIDRSRFNRSLKEKIALTLQAFKNKRKQQLLSSQSIDRLQSKGILAGRVKSKEELKRYLSKSESKNNIKSDKKDWSESRTRRSEQSIDKGRNYSKTELKLAHVTKYSDQKSNNQYDRYKKPQQNLTSNQTRSNLRERINSNNTSNNNLSNNYNNNNNNNNNGYKNNEFMYLNRSNNSNRQKNGSSEKLNNKDAINSSQSQKNYVEQNKRFISPLKWNIKFSPSKNKFLHSRSLSESAKLLTTEFSAFGYTEDSGNNTGEQRLQIQQSLQNKQFIPQQLSQQQLQQQQIQQQQQQQYKQGNKKSSAQQQFDECVHGIKSFLAQNKAELQNLRQDIEAVSAQRKKNDQK